MLEFGASGRKQVDFIARDQRVYIVDLSHFAQIRALDSASYSDTPLWRVNGWIEVFIAESHEAPASGVRQPRYFRSAQGTLQDLNARAFS